MRFGDPPAIDVPITAAMPEAASSDRTVAAEVTRPAGVRRRGDRPDERCRMMLSPEGLRAGEGRSANASSLGSALRRTALTGP